MTAPFRHTTIPWAESRRCSSQREVAARWAVTIGTGASAYKLKFKSDVKDFAGEISGQHD
jgi:hypothetical protein